MCVGRGRGIWRGKVASEEARESYVFFFLISARPHTVLPMIDVISFDEEGVAGIFIHFFRQLTYFFLLSSII
jgi:hypothetical protein